MESSQLIAVGITISVALLIGIALTRLSHSTSVVKPEVTGRDPLERLPSKGAPVLPTPLREVVETLPIPAQDQQRVAAALSTLVAKQVETKVDSVKRELSHQYEQIVHEKSQEVAVAHQQHREAMAQQRQTESILKSVAEGLVVVNSKGEVMFVNEAAEKLLGVKQHEKVGKPLTEGLADEQLLSLVKTSLTQQPGELEIELTAKQDQTRRIVRSSNAVIQDESGKAVGMVSVLSDVTKQRELDRMKSEFVSSVTHELRTPTVAIQHSLSVLMDQTAGQLSETQRNFLVIAQRNLERLSRMINDLLDLAKLEGRRMDLQREQVSLMSVIQGACETLQAWAHSKGVRLEQRLADSLPELPLDADKVTQILYNLIGNAIKCTPAGGIVTVETRLQDGGNAVHVSVRDTGIGIAKDDIPKLFQKFQRVQTQEPGALRGTGLGLAITKALVELHGGVMWVESEQGRGACFAFTLPLIPPHQAGKGS